MRTLLLVGIAGLAAFTADGARANHLTGDRSTERQVERRVIVVDRSSEGDEAVYRSRDDRMPAEGEYRRHHGADYGDYSDRRPDRHERRVIRHREDFETYCRRDDGVGGALIGAVAGGVAGNRIAGRGNRAEGTILGAVGGAVVGTAIDRAEDADCREWRARNDVGYHTREWRDDDRYAGYGSERYAGRGYAYEATGSEAYYAGGTTTIVIPGAPIIIEETETIYETVTVPAPRARAAPRRAVRHRAPARPRPRCVCR